MSTTRKLRLGPLPKTESIKVTFACPASLEADLDRYAALHAQTYGEAVDATLLIPHMLEAFMAWDRGFRKETRARPHRRSQADDAGSGGRPRLPSAAGSVGPGLRPLTRMPRADSSPDKVRARESNLAFPMALSPALWTRVSC